MSAADNGKVDLSQMEPLFQKYAGPPGALIPILQKTQGVYGYLPKEVLQLIAKRLGVSLSKVYGVATFYAQFYLERKGKHMVKLCDGTACHVKGAPRLMDVIEDEYDIQPGETTEDGELTEEIVYCLGSCALAPAAVLDGKVMGHLRPEPFLQRLKKHVAASRQA